MSQEQSERITYVILHTFWTYFHMTPVFQDQFAATLDGNTTVGNGFAPEPGLFQQILFSQTGLQSEYHMLVMTDTSTRNDRPFLDIDYVEFTTGDGDHRFTKTCPIAFFALTTFGLVPCR
jgi:hypothetical protein